MKRHSLLSLLVLTQVGVGCATLVNGTTQRVAFDSRPPGATVKVGGEMVTTPSTLQLARKHTYEVSFDKPGYVRARRHIGQKTSSAFVGNVLLGGVIGVIVDPWSGGMYDLYPATLSVTLVPDPSICPDDRPCGP